MADSYHCVSAGGSDLYGDWVECSCGWSAPGRDEETGHLFDLAQMVDELIGHILEAQTEAE